MISAVALPPPALQHQKHPRYWLQVGLHIAAISTPSPVRCCFERKEQPLHNEQLWKL